MPRASRSSTRRSTRLTWRDVAKCLDARHGHPLVAARAARPRLRGARRGARRYPRLGRRLRRGPLDGPGGASTWMSRRWSSPSADDALPQPPGRKLRRARAGRPAPASSAATPIKTDTPETGSATALSMATRTSRSRARTGRTRPRRSRARPGSPRARDRPRLFDRPSRRRAIRCAPGWPSSASPTRA